MAVTVRLCRREDFQDAVDFVAGIDHHGLAGGFVAEDGAVALQHADGKDLVDHKASILTNMGEILTALMRWVHISSVVTLIGGIMYARFVMIPSAGSLSPDARTALDEGAAAHFRPVVFAAMTGLVISGLFNYLSKPGHSVLYHVAVRREDSAGAARVQRRDSGDGSEESAAGAAVVRGGDFGADDRADFGVPEGDRLN